jgi:hypothetical protein
LQESAAERVAVLAYPLVGERRTIDELMASSEAEELAKATQSESAHSVTPELLQLLNSELL